MKGSVAAVSDFGDILSNLGELLFGAGAPGEGGLIDHGTFVDNSGAHQVVMDGNGTLRVPDTGDIITENTPGYRK
jgi:hypothetical protein